MVELYDFWAEWCQPCKQMEPVFEELKKEYADTVNFKEIDVDADPDTASKFGVLSIPTYIVMKDGQEIGRVTGAVGKGPIVDRLTQALT